jgi:hypothetical protein
MTTLFDKLKDNREAGIYKQNCMAGFLNQKNLLFKLKKEFGIDFVICKEEDFIENVNKDLGYYLPDAFIFLDDIWHLTEIKVTMFGIKEEIHLKKLQIDFLAKRNGIILYADNNKFGFCKARNISNNIFPINSKRINKLCYPVPRGMFKWHEFKIKFIIQSYKQDK